MIEILGTTYYMLTWVQTAFALFLVLLLILSIIIKKITRRLFITLILIIPAAGYGSKYIFEDVYLTGNTARTLCEKDSGIHIYEKEQARGFVSLDPFSWQKQGFDYTEYPLDEKKYRETYYGGKVARYEVKSYISKHRVLRKSSFVFRDKIEKMQYQVKNIENNKVLGELVYYQVYPGWVDSKAQEIVGSNINPWKCGNKKNNKKLSYSDVVKETLSPEKNE